MWEGPILVGQHKIMTFVIRSEDFAFTETELFKAGQATGTLKRKAANDIQDAALQDAVGKETSRISAFYAKTFHELPAWLTGASGVNYLVREDALGNKQKERRARI